MLKIIIVGATSGIGRELARLYAGNGDLVGVTGRRNELLYTLQVEYPNNIVTECFDVTTGGATASGVSANGPTAHLESLVDKMEGLDLLIYNAGFGDLTETLDWEVDKTTVDINVNGFLEVIHFGWHYFVAQGHGHLVTTSSIAANRGNRHSPAYSASKAFESIYFEGLHIKARKMGIPIYITDVQPGFVDTKMAKGPTFWVASPQKAARQMMQAIDRRRWRVYITRRWWLVAKIFKWLPGWIYHRIG
jgi:short-subunit dehydrogenase